MPPSSTSFSPETIAQEAELFAQTQDGRFLQTALWGLWAERLERQPDQRLLLEAIGYALDKGRRDHVIYRDLEERCAPLASPLKPGLGETRLWHHLLLYGGARRFTAAQAWLKAGFDPWADEQTTPLPLLLATGDVALCALLCERLPQQTLSERFLQAFPTAPPHTLERSLYELGRWCVEQRQRVDPGNLLATQVGTSFTALSYENHLVPLTAFAGTDDDVVQWWRFIHPETQPPPLPLPLVNKLLTRRSPAPLTQDSITRLWALFEAPVQEQQGPGEGTTVDSVGGEGGTGAQDLRRLLIQSAMRNAFKERSSKRGPTLLTHLDAFLTQKGVRGYECTSARRFNKFTPDALKRLQPLLVEWAHTLPLDMTLEYNKGSWSLPALLVHEIFEPLCPSGSYSPLQHQEARTATVWMTLLLNAVWQVASPAIKKAWMEESGPPQQGESTRMTRPWLFWGARLHAFMRQECLKLLPDLALPSEVTLPATTRNFLSLYPTKSKKTAPMEQLKEELFTWDRAHHPAVWETPDLFTRERLETLWMPFLSSKQTFELPGRTTLFVTQAMRKLLDAHPEPGTLPAHLVLPSCRALLEEFFLENKAFPQEHSHREPSSFYTLGAAIEKWLVQQPQKVMTDWCALKLGTEEATTRWRMFWEERFLESILATPMGVSEKTSPLKRRQRV